MTEVVVEWFEVLRKVKDFLSLENYKNNDIGGSIGESTKYSLLRKFKQCFKDISFLLKLKHTSIVHRRDTGGMRRNYISSRLVVASLVSSDAVPWILDGPATGAVSAEGPGPSLIANLAI